MRRLVLLVLLLFASATHAATTSYYDVTTTWQDLGAGPVQFQVAGGSSGCAYFIGDAPPVAGAPAFTLLPSSPAVSYQGASHVYVRAIYSSGARVVYGLFPTGGGTGGTSALPPQAVTMTTTNNAITGNAAAATLLQTNSIRKYLNVFNSTGGACRYSYGTTNAAPTSTAGMPLPAAVGFTLEASAITYQSMSFWCAQTGTVDITEGQ